MNSKMRRILTFLPLLLATELAQADTLPQLYVSSYTLGGSPVEVILSMAGLGDDAPSVSSYDLNFNFDPSQFSFKQAVFGDQLKGNQLDIFHIGTNLTSASVISPGVLNLFELSLDSAELLNDLQADSFNLVTLSFDVLRLGTGEMSISINALADADGNPLAVETWPIGITTVP
ncbi:MAG: cohesin domain-containing protein, partial [Methylococcales bacterium]